MDRHVDAIAGLLDLALARLELAVVADFHEAARGHLGPVQAERDLVIAVVGAGDAQGEVVENALVEPVHHGEPVRGGEIDPRLPLRRGYVDAGLDRFQKHGLSPVGCWAVNSATAAVASMAIARSRPVPGAGREYRQRAARL